MYVKYVDNQIKMSIMLLRGHDKYNNFPFSKAVQAFIVIIKKWDSFGLILPF